ncbi:MAG: zf-HC2 domain-containing protein [Rubrobacter sp.]|jgi:anti-sigma factor RsiW|nr:zf-HC2 domain-containing protein [Rubrobacter sp.]
MSREGKCCDPEAVFELVDGALGPNRRRELFSHLEGCPGCREHYEWEKALSESLCSAGEDAFEAPSVCREVAMALPTRSVRMRFLWAVLALGILLSAGVALSLDGMSPFVMASGPLEALWSVSSGFADIAAMMLAFAGPVILVALVVGAALDILLAGAVFSAIRRQAASGARRA